MILSVLAFAGAVAAASGDSTVTRGTVVDMPAAGEGAQSAEGLPRRGMTMAAVEREHGKPRVRHDAVGDPPITRWDYEDFSVFFEHERVLHSVVPGDFPQIRNRDELQQ